MVLLSMSLVSSLVLMGVAKWVFHLSVLFEHMTSGSGSRISLNNHFTRTHILPTFPTPRLRKGDYIFIKAA